MAQHREAGVARAAVAAGASRALTNTPAGQGDRRRCPCGARARWRRRRRTRSTTARWKRAATQAPGRRPSRRSATTAGERRGAQSTAPVAPAVAERVAVAAPAAPAGERPPARWRPAPRSRRGGRRPPARTTASKSRPMLEVGDAAEARSELASQQPQLLVAAGPDARQLARPRRSPAARRWDSAIRHGLRTPASPPGSGDVRQVGDAGVPGVVGEQELAAPDRAVVAVPGAVERDPEHAAGPVVPVLGHRRRRRARGGAAPATTGRPAGVVARPSDGTGSPGAGRRRPPRARTPVSSSRCRSAALEGPLGARGRPCRRRARTARPGARRRGRRCSSGRRRPRAPAGARNGRCTGIGA